MATCYRHPSRETGVSCSNCGRPICTDCMTPTPVGMRCPECAGQRTEVRTIRRDSPLLRRGLPRVTWFLLAVNIIVFLGERGQFTIAGSGVGGYLVDHGFLARVLIVEAHQYWRLFTNSFLHENILHIGFNMYLLYLLGMMLEPALGSVRFAAIYVTAIFVGSLGVEIATQSPSLGASGAIFGLMGAAAVELRARGMSIMQSGIGGLIVLNLVYSFLVPNISIGDHIGGLVGGALAGLILRWGDSRRSLALGLGGCAVLTVAAIAASVAMPAGGI